MYGEQLTNRTRTPAIVLVLEALLNTCSLGQKLMPGTCRMEREVNVVTGWGRICLEFPKSFRGLAVLTHTVQSDQGHSND